MECKSSRGKAQCKQNFGTHGVVLLILHEIGWRVLLGNRAARLWQIFGIDKPSFEQLIADECYDHLDRSFPYFTTNPPSLH